MSLAERIRQARKAGMLTQEELGQKIGQTAGAITNYERGTREPNIQQLKMLATVLNVSVAWLIDVDYYHEEQEKCLLEIYRSLNSAGKSNLIMLAETIASTPAYKKDSVEDT